MYPDLKELLSVLNECGVKYLVVGAYAVSMYAQPRATKDLDIWIKPDPENAEAVFAALMRFGAPLQGVTPGDLAEQGPFFQMGRQPIAVDILTEIPGISFDTAWERRHEATVDEERGLKAWFLSREDLIAAKRASGGPQDLADIDAIDRAQKSRKRDRQ